MLLHCLGTAGFHPNHDRHTSCYFLPEAGVLLDAGTGAFRLAPLIETDEIDLLLSHAHLDHIAGLTFLIDVFYQRPIKQLRIWGEAAKLSAIRKHLFSELVFPVQLDSQLDTQWNAIDELTEFQAGGAKVSWRPQDHPGGSVAYRLDWGDGQSGDGKAANGKLADEKPADEKPADGKPADENPAEKKSLLYMTDTTGDVSDEGIEWCRDADLLMHECYFDDSMADFAQKTGHSWTSRVAEVAARAKPKTLLVTHINPLIGATDIKCGAGVKKDMQPGKLPKDFAPQCDLIREKVEAEVLLAADELVVEF